MIKLEESLKKVNAGNEDESGEMKTIRNKYKWLLKKEEAKARAKGPEPEQIKAEAIVILDSVTNIKISFNKILFLTS